MLPAKLSKSLLILATLVVLSGAYLVLAGTTVEHTTVQYDEFTDLVIATSLSQNPLSGHSYDGSQARFPMYVTAVAYRFLQLVNPNLDLLGLLPVSRWISIFMTVLAIWGTYILGTILFNRATGVVAAALFALSPYVLHFGRDALTQGDAFTSATVVFACIAFVEFNNKRTTFWLACLSFCLALSIAAKFYLVILIPAFIAYQLAVHFGKSYERQLSAPDPAKTDSGLHGDRSFIFLTIVTGVFTLLALVLSLSRSDQTPAVSNLLNQVARMLWLFALLGIFVSAVFAIRTVGIWRSRSRKPAVYWHLGLAWLAILPLSFAMVLALFPTHIFNPFVIPTLLERFITMDGNGVILATTMDSAKLYLGIILLKLGLPLGILTCAALVWAVKKSLSDRAYLLIVVTLFFFALMLAALPLQQPFWLISVYPLIVLVLSAMIVHVFASLKKTGQRLAWTAAVGLASAWLVVGLVQVYPTYGYYGYELIGDQWLGENSCGYRAVVVVTNDGSTEAIDWLRQNVPDGSSVLSYLNDVHIIKYLDLTEPFDFELAQALQYSDKNQLAGDLARADYVVVRSVDDQGCSAPVSDVDFIARFGTEPVFEIVRGRGIYQMPVIQIFQRLAATDSYTVQK